MTALHYTQIAGARETEIWLQKLYFLKLPFGLRQEDFLEQGKVTWSCKFKKPTCPLPWKGEGGLAEAAFAPVACEGGKVSKPVLETKDPAVWNEMGTPLFPLAFQHCGTTLLGPACSG